MMRRRAITLLTALVITAIPAGDSWGGAWTQKDGEMYHRLATTYYFADEFFDSSGSRQNALDGAEFTDINLSYYVEYGLVDSFTVLATFPYKYLMWEDQSVKNEIGGLADVDLGLRYRLVQGKAGVLSIQGLVKIPEAYDEEADLPLGDGIWGVEARLLYGRSLWSRKSAYSGVEVGYRWRSDSADDEIRYLLEFGLYATKSVYGRFKLDGIYLPDPQNDGDGSSANPTAQPGMELGKLDATVGIDLTPAWALELQLVRDLYGTNAPAGQSIAAAAVWQLKR